MPKPVGDSGAYIPGLDGIRALAVLAVLGYHLGLPYFSGGLLGVGVFFTLSGFLITRILLTSWSRTGTLELRRFWLHRARRLLPALGLVLAVVLVGTAFTDPDALAERWGETWSAAAYVANWHTIAAGESYFERFVGPGPLDHLWSLSVEEQFYLVWPVLLLVALRGFGMRRRQLVYLTAGLTAGSFLLLGVLASPGFDHTRAYEGTDTRAGGILVGALLALVWDRVVAAGNLPDVRAAAQAAGILGLAGIAWLVVSTDDYSMQLYSYGLLLLSVCSAGLIAAVAMPGSALGRVLGIAPMRWLGERSYGIYLWQLPIIAFLPAARLESSRLGLVGAAHRHDAAARRAVLAAGRGPGPAARPGRRRTPSPPSAPPHPHRSPDGASAAAPGRGALRGAGRHRQSGLLPPGRRRSGRGRADRRRTRRGPAAAAAP